MFYILCLTYLIGGISFIPLLLTFFFFYLNYQVQFENFRKESNLLRNQKQNNLHSISSELSCLPDDQPLLPELLPDSPRLYRAGWLTVRHSYDNPSSSESGYMGLITNSYRNFIDNRSTHSKRTRVKDLFYSVLKQNVLFLYPDQEQVECTAAIKISLYQVDLYPTGSPDPELFVKRKAIRLTPIFIHPSNDENHEKSTPSVDLHSDHQQDHPSPWFIFTKNNLEKEDWYHLLIAASKLSQSDSKATFQRDTSLFDSQDMAKLVEGIDQQPDPIPMRWMNAMLGRLFLSSYRTHAFENWIIDRIMKKLAKVQTPSFLSAINVREVNVGSTTPFFSKPMLKELTIDGDASMEVMVNYKGQFSITVETVATVNLGARFKPYAVNLVLIVVLKELSGTLLLKIKRPPTNRLWFGFTAMPHLILDLQPVVSTRQVKWALVLKPIESRIREVVMESLVYPNLDDLVFFDTQAYAHPGGIWGDAARKEKENSTPETRDDQTSDPPSHVEDSKPENNSSSPSCQDSNLEPESTHIPKTSLTTAREDSSLSHDTLRMRTKSSSLGESSSDPNPAGESSYSYSTPSANQSESKRSSWFSTSRRQDTTSTQSSQNLTRNHPKVRPVAQQSSELEDGDAVAMLQKFLRSHPEASPSSSPLPTPHLEQKLSTCSPSVFQPVRSSPRSDNLEIDSVTPIHALSNNVIHAEPIQLAEGPTDKKNSAAAPSTPKRSSNYSKEASPFRPIPPTSLRAVPPPPAQSLPATFLPPPQRTAQSVRLTNATNNQSANSSILNQLRTRATDKEAIAASVTQARDVVIKWGASWASKRKSPQAHHSIYPYNSGFNPIRIDELEQGQEPQPSSTSSARAPDPSNIVPGSIDHTKNVAENPPSVWIEAQEDEVKNPEATPLNRGRKAIETSQADDLSSSSSPMSISRSAPSFQENQVSLEDESLNQEKQKPFESSKLTSTILTSNSINKNEEEERHSGTGSNINNSNGKRNRIFSSNGQFVPPAPQSTTGLSIHSSPRSEVLAGSQNSNNSSVKLVSVLDDGSEPHASASTSGELIAHELNSLSRSSTTAKKSEILSEKSSYKPAQMMAIPGIKDSSHRFGLGSDSIPKLGLPQQQQTSLSNASGMTKHATTSSDTSLSLTDLHSHINDPDSRSIESHANVSLYPSSAIPQTLSHPTLELNQSNLYNQDEQGKEIFQKNDSSHSNGEKNKLGQNRENEELRGRKSSLGIDELDSKRGHDDHNKAKTKKIETGILEFSDQDQLKSLNVSTNPLTSSLPATFSSNVHDQVHNENRNQNDSQGDQGKVSLDNSTDSPVDHLAWGF